MSDHKLSSYEANIDSAKIRNFQLIRAVSSKKMTEELPSKGVIKHHILFAVSIIHVIFFTRRIVVPKRLVDISYDL